MKISEINEGLRKNDYIPTKEILYAVSGAINQQFPILVEGDPGVGKTALAKAIANMLGLPLYRVQFYEGLSADVAKLPKYDDLGTGSSALCVDNGDFYKYEATTKTWYKV